MPLTNPTTSPSTTDADEAFAVLARALYAKHPDADARKGERETAAKGLLTQLCAQAERAGYKASAGKDGQQEYVLVAPLAARGGSAAWIIATEDGLSMGLQRYGQVEHSSKLDVPLEFDPVLGEWTGEELDTEHVPVPGELQARKRSGLVVAAEALATLLGKVS